MRKAESRKPMNTESAVRGQTSRASHGQADGVCLILANKPLSRPKPLTPQRRPSTQRRKNGGRGYFLRSAFCLGLCGAIRIGLIDQKGTGRYLLNSHSGGFKRRTIAERLTADFADKRRYSGFRFEGSRLSGWKSRKIGRLLSQPMNC